MTATAEYTAELSAEQRDLLRLGLAGDREATQSLINRLVSDLDSLTEARKDGATDDEHDPEGPTLAFERSQSTAILGQTRDHLAKIDVALLRVESDDYGRCVSCGTAIPFARLEVRPYSTQCVSCASKARR